MHMCGLMEMHIIRTVTFKLQHSFHNFEVFSMPGLSALSLSVQYDGRSISLSLHTSVVFLCGKCYRWALVMESG